MTQYALPMEFAELRKLATEIEQRLDENRDHEGYKFINSEIKKVFHVEHVLKTAVDVMNKITGKYNLVAYIEKVVLPLPNQDTKEARYLVGVRSKEGEYSSSKKIENYYFVDEIKKKGKDIAEELCQGLVGRQNAREVLVN